MKIKYLKKDAVPSVFNFPDHLKKKVAPPRSVPKIIIQSSSVEPPIPSSKQPRLDHNYATKSSPRKAKKLYQEKLKKMNLIIKNLWRKNIRKQKTIGALVAKLKQYRILSEESGNSFLENFGHMSLFKNEVKNINRSSGSSYSNEIKEFAISLHFYSPRAYRFVRKALHLPHPSTLRSLSVNVECEPGFLQKPLGFVEQKVNEGQKDCVLSVDELAIKKTLEWDKRNFKFAGHVDYGNLKGEPLDLVASNALVLLASGLQRPWFVPIGYFLTNSVNADILQHIIFEAINLLTEKGAEVHAVIFDGAPKNISMAKKLGCNIEKLDGTFDHPSKPGRKVNVILDVFLMIIMPLVI